MTVFDKNNPTVLENQKYMFILQDFFRVFSRGYAKEGSILNLKCNTGPVRLNLIFTLIDI